MCSSMRIIPRPMRPTWPGVTAGFAATGRLPAGYFRASRGPRAACPIRCRCSRGGRSPTIFAAVFLGALLDLIQRPEDAAAEKHLPEVMSSFSRHFAQALFTFACLPYEAFFALDAIARAMWRMLFSHRRLLEWNASGEHNGTKHQGLPASFGRMWSAPFYSVACLAGLSAVRPSSLFVALPMLLVWSVCPAVAWWISRPITRESVRLTAEQLIFLRKLARSSWSFFERFVGPEDHWLPPDNFQESPGPIIAHRTSPTDIGLALLANLSAWDFGYLSGAQLMQRTSRTFQTMASLERHRRHFYNWYDTVTLRPLPPLYVSTVDSGNLCAHLLILEAGLAALADHPILAPRWPEGLRETLWVVIDALKKERVKKDPGKKEAAKRELLKKSAPPDTDLTRPALLEADSLLAILDALCASPPA